MLTASEKNFMREALSKGATEEQVVAFVQKKRNEVNQETPVDVNSIENLMSPKEELPSVGDFKPDTDPDVYQGTTAEFLKPAGEYLTSEQFGRPMIEGTLGAVGGAIGAPLGPWGSVAGGGSGIAIGSNISDMIWNPEKVNKATEGVLPMAEYLGEKYKEGGEAEALGLGIGSGIRGALEGSKLAGKGAKGVYNWLRGMPSKAKQRAESRAGRIIADFLSRDFTDSVMGKELEELEALRKEFPELDFGLGQASNNRDLLALREQSRNLNPQKYDRLLEEQQVRNRKKLIDYMKQFFDPKGPSVEDTMEALKRVRSAVEAGEVAAGEDMALLAEATTGIKGADQIADDIKNVARKAREVAKDALDARWAEQPDQALHAGDFYTWLETFPNRWLKEEGADLTDDFVTFIEQVKNDFSRSDGLLRPRKEIMLQQLRKRGQKAGQNAWELGAKEPARARQYYALRDKIDDIIQTVQGDGYSKLKADYSNFKKTFDEGPVGEMLDWRKNLSGSKIAKKFFSSGDPRNVAQLRRALGDTRARELLRAEALVNLKNSPAYDKSSGELRPDKLKIWLDNNKRVIEEAGLKPEFGDTAKIADALINAQKNNKAFQSQSFYKYLNEEPKNFFSKVFSGDKNKTEIAKEILRALDKLKGDPAALKGMQKGFLDHVRSRVDVLKDGQRSLNAKEFGDLMDEFEGAMKLIFAGAPEKLNAMRNSRKILDVLSRGSSRTEGDLIPKTMTLKGLKSLIPFIFNRYAMASGARGAVDLMSGMNREMIEDILVKTAFDPVYANKVYNARTPDEVLETLMPLLGDENKNYWRNLLNSGQAAILGTDYKYGKPAYDKMKEAD